jgi:hypothetical protein
MTFTQSVINVSMALQMINRGIDRQTAGRSYKPTLREQENNNGNNYDDSNKLHGRNFSLNFLT